MTVIVKNIIPRKQAENAQTAQYTAVNCKCVIDKFTVTNTAAANIPFSVNLLPDGGTASAANCVLSARSIAPGETYTCPQLVGQVLEAGGIISTLAGTATALTISAAGREIT
jgi:hypothetical protein